MLSIRLRPLHVFAMAALLALSPTAFADKPIEQQMRPEQFKAAGLDKLSPQELANLNAWLKGTLEVETTKAAELAKDKIVQEHRGFATFGRNDPIVATLVGEFSGFGKGHVYKLDNGQEWMQTDDAKVHGVRKTNPPVRIAPSLIGNAWYMKVEGSNTMATVRRTK
ncbi:hypothetical protein [Lysobacter fragariae]